MIFALVIALKYGKELKSKLETFMFKDLGALNSGQQLSAILNNLGLTHLGRITAIASLWLAMT